MKAFNVRVMSKVTVGTGDKMDLSQALDLLEFEQVDVVVNVLIPAEGDAPSLVFEHAPCNEAGAYLAFETPMEVDLTVAGSTWFHADHVTRWAAWRTTGTFNVSAQITLDLIARA